MRIAYLGTTTLLMDDGRDQLLFDCHVSRPSLMRYLFGRLDTDRGVADRVIQDFHIDRLRGIFISHTHHDHVLDAPYFAVKCGAAVYGSPSAVNVARGGGVPEDRLFCFSERMEHSIGGFRVRVMPSIHSAPRWYNDDIGQTIDAPLRHPARRRDFREGGSFDFVVESGDWCGLIRPSCNFIRGQLDGVRADTLFLGIGGLSRNPETWRREFFSETVDRVRPRTVVPIHWDDFFSPLYGPVKGLPAVAENTGASLRLLADHCIARGVFCAVLPPLSWISQG